MFKKKLEIEKVEKSIKTENFTILGVLIVDTGGNVYSLRDEEGIIQNIYISHDNSEITISRGIDFSNIAGSTLVCEIEYDEDDNFEVISGHISRV